MTNLPNSSTATLAGSLALCLCLMSILWAMYLLARRKSGRDRVLLGLMGVLSVSHGAHLLREMGYWQASANAQVDTLATLSVAAIYFLAIYVIGRWGIEHRSASTQLRVLEEGLMLSSPGLGDKGSPEMLAAILDALPLAIRVTGKHGKVLFRNEAARQQYRVEVPEATPTQMQLPWAVPVGHAVSGWQLQVEAVNSAWPS